MWLYLTRSSLNLSYKATLQIEHLLLTELLPLIVVPCFRPLTETSCTLCWLYQMMDVLHGVISAEELPDNRLTLLFSNGTAEWNSAGWWHTNGSGRWVTWDTRLTIALSNEAKLQGPAPTVTDCKYIGWERKFESKAPWTPSTFHRAILSLQDMLSVWSPLPGFLLKLPVTCQLTPSPWGSLASPGTHLAPVLLISKSTGIHFGWLGLVSDWVPKATYNSSSSPQRQELSKQLIVQVRGTEAYHRHNTVEATSNYIKHNSMEYDLKCVGQSILVKMAASPQGGWLVKKWNETLGFTFSFP